MYPRDEDLWSLQLPTSTPVPLFHRCHIEVIPTRLIEPSIFAFVCRNWDVKSWRLWRLDEGLSFGPKCCNEPAWLCIQFAVWIYKITEFSLLQYWSKSLRRKKGWLILYTVDSTFSINEGKYVIWLHKYCNLTFIFQHNHLPKFFHFYGQANFYFHGNIRNSSWDLYA